MGSNVIISVVITIIVVAAAVYGTGYFMRKKNQDRLNTLEKRKEDLFDLPVIEEIDDVKRMHLVGQSQNTFREWSQLWTEISTSDFAELESQIFEVESLNETFRFLKAQAAIGEVEAIISKMERQVEEVREGLKALRETEERNSLNVQKALDVYEELERQLKETSEVFGPAHSELLKQLKNIEIAFTQFVTLNTSGDPVEASEVLHQAEDQTYELEKLMAKIPPLFEDLHETFPEQMTEIQEGYEKLLADHYVIPVENFQETITRVHKRIENSLKDLEKTEIATIESDNHDTADAIESLYTTMEHEIEAKKYVVKHRAVIKEYIEHATKNNRQLLIELDHTAQSYALNHNELSRVRGFQTEIDELARQHQVIEPQLAEHEIAYSEVEKFYKEAYKVMDEVENQQIEIDDEIRNLRKDEKNAQEKIEEYEFKIRNLKRFVEKQRLPGLPGDYLELFFVASDRIEELGKALNKIRINIEEVNELVRNCQDDLKLLDKTTTELVDAAALTEQMMQYANRYRYSHPEIKSSIEKCLHLFTTDFQYQAALDEIGVALERVEPGAFERIETFYFNHPDLV
ncbi:MAG: septation ring formation regulator EzrA [Enterococcus sp.]